MAATEIEVEVAFALPERQRIVTLAVPEGTTARQAVRLAGLETLFPELPPSTFGEADLGIFGKPLRDPDHQVLRAGDRVEVYRPLVIDPKAARAERARTKR
ncbi:RnfH family protein [Halomonas sp. LBP4]|uniref:RnfH family protein n=1 Tax=Halomonas sp. LBP4 TaxID=2044917 RepID=UPI000D769EAF|nr:RnfH family protein [Halomonas sp. LBP4]PXX94849.1 RnfH family protein [Halomonas sp. LBP4]